MGGHWFKVATRPGDGLGFRLAGAPVEELAQGEEAARFKALLADASLGVLVDRYQGPLVGYLTGIVNDAERARDLAQETFLRIYRHASVYRTTSRFTTWLFHIARNVARDHFRSRRAHLSLEHATEIAAPERMEDEVEHRSDARRLASLLLELAERERELISLKYGAECTNREIARLTGISETNVGTILHRTARRLRDLWGEE